MPELPLDGLVVVAFEQAVAAPFATRQLADLGARVIKIERPEGDFARGYDHSVQGESSYFVWLNRGKQSVVLDLKSSLGREAARRLVDRADVLVQNLAPGAIDRLGLGASPTRATNPRLIHASLSGYGRGGPDEQRKAYDLLLQCEAGLLSVTGNEEPAKVGISVADICAGMYLYSGVLTALLRRNRTDVGSTIEVSMLEALGEWMMQPMYYATQGGRQPARSGPRHATIAPYGPFPASDGTVFLGVQSDREWVILCGQLIGEPAFGADLRFATNPARVAHREELDEVVGQATMVHTSADLVERLDRMGIANARMRDMQQLADHPQLEARGRWRTIQLPNGTAPALIPPVTMDGMEWTMGAVPRLGADTESVLAEVGLTQFREETKPASTAPDAG